VVACRRNVRAALHDFFPSRLKAGMSPSPDGRVRADVSGPADDREPAGPRRRPAGFATTTIVMMLNAVVAGLGGLYVSTGSIAVTVLAAILVAILALIVIRAEGR
jgi:hypothetical protein